MKYEWDETKRQTNLKKHGIDFADAVVFEDDYALTRFDPDHHNEQRLLTLGMGFNDRVLLVVNVQRFEGVIRIISARPATKKEKKQYETGI